MARPRKPIPAELIDDYQRGVYTLEDISNEIGMSQAQVWRRAKAEGWFERDDEVQQQVKEVTGMMAGLALSDLAKKSRRESADQYLNLINAIKYKIAQHLKNDPSPGTIRTLTDSLKTIAQIEEGLTGFGSGHRMLVEAEMGTGTAEGGGEVTVRLIEELAHPETDDRRDSPADTVSRSAEDDI